MPQGNNRRSNAEDVERVVRALEEDIIFGVLRQRERLIEDVLLARFTVKRHVVRQALVELEKLGIVTRERNKGAMVRGFEPEEVEAIYEMREMLHERAALRMALPPPPGLLERLEDIHRRHTAATEGRDLRAIYLLNDAFHHELFGACGNPHLMRTIVQYDGLSHPIRSLRIGDADMVRAANREHAAMIAALREGEGGRARLARLCVEHIRPSKNAYLAIYGWTAGRPAA